MKYNKLYYAVPIIQIGLLATTIVNIMLCITYKSNFVLPFSIPLCMNGLINGLNSVDSVIYYCVVYISFGICLLISLLTIKEINQKSPKALMMGSGVLCFTICGNYGYFYTTEKVSIIDGDFTFYYIAIIILCMILIARCIQIRCCKKSNPTIFEKYDLIHRSEKYGTFFTSKSINFFENYKDLESHFRALLIPIVMASLAVRKSTSSRFIFLLVIEVSGIIYFNYNYYKLVNSGTEIARKDLLAKWNIFAIFPTVVLVCLLLVQF